MKRLLENFKRYLSEEEEEDLTVRDKIMIMLNNAMNSRRWGEYKHAGESGVGAADDVLRQMEAAYMIASADTGLDIPKFNEIPQKLKLKRQTARQAANKLAYLVPHVNKFTHEIIFSHLKELIVDAAAQKNPADKFIIFPATSRRFNVLNRLFVRGFRMNDELRSLMEQYGLDSYEIAEYFELNR